MLIAFGHRRRAGKDTACNFCVTHARTTTKRQLIVKAAFADKMKSMCHDLYAWAGLREGSYYDEHPELKEQIIPALGKSPRQIYIEFGSTVGRAIFEDTWLEFVLRTKAEQIYISDLRFVNEAKAVLLAGGRVFRIDNPRIEIHHDVADANMKDFKDWTGVIVNDGDLHTFHARVLKAVFNVDFLKTGS